MNADKDEKKEAFVTIAKASRLLGVHHSVLKRQIEKGTFPTLELGDTIRISRAYIDRILAKAEGAELEAIAPEKKKRGPKPKRKAVKA